MDKTQSTRRRRKFWRTLKLAEWLSLIGLTLVALKAAFELAKAIIVLLQ